MIRLVFLSCVLLLLRSCIGFIPGARCLTLHHATTLPLPLPLPLPLLALQQQHQSQSNNDNCNDNDNNHHKKKHKRLPKAKHNSSNSRRHLLSHLLITTIATTTATLSSPHPTHAACLSGDISPNCIGFYKVPIDPAILPYISTPESLERYAPGLKWVPPPQPPPNYASAVEELRALRDTLKQQLEGLVFGGKLEESGVLVLGVVPRVTLAGGVVLEGLQRRLDVLEKSIGSGESQTQSTDKNVLSMRVYRVDVALQTLKGDLGQCDVLLGQGLRGELGALTAAQIAILPTVKDILNDFDELMVAIPETSK